jgi:prepilin-type N-terminal cleavage/methylation domain-containing protein
MTNNHFTFNKSQIMSPNLLQKTVRKLERSVSDNSTGFTLTELIATMVIVGIMAVLAGPMLNSNMGTRPLDDSTNRVAGTLNLMRVKATSQTSAYRFRLGSSSNFFLVEYAPTCTSASSEWKSDGSFLLEDRTLGKAVTFSSVTPNPTVSPWSVCFDNRGMADRSLDIRLADSSTTRRVQVFQGGSIQMY